MKCLYLFAFLLALLDESVCGKSAKKGVCIPPGENFHCGDLAGLDNVRYVSLHQPG